MNLLQRIVQISQPLERTHKSCCSWFEVCPPCAQWEKQSRHTDYSKHPSVKPPPQPHPTLRLHIASVLLARIRVNGGGCLVDTTYLCSLRPPIGWYLLCSKYAQTSNEIQARKFIGNGCLATCMMPRASHNASKTASTPKSLNIII